MFFYRTGHPQRSRPGPAEGWLGPSYDNVDYDDDDDDDDYDDDDDDDKGYERRCLLLHDLVELLLDCS